MPSLIVKKTDTRVAKITKQVILAHPPVISVTQDRVNLEFANADGGRERIYIDGHYNAMSPEELNVVEWREYMLHPFAFQHGVTPCLRRPWKTCRRKSSRLSKTEKSPAHRRWT